MGIFSPPVSGRGFCVAHLKCCQARKENAGVLVSVEPVGFSAEMNLPDCAPDSQAFSKPAVRKEN